MGKLGSILENSATIQLGDMKDQSTSQAEKEKFEKLQFCADANTVVRKFMKADPTNEKYIRNGAALRQECTDGVVSAFSQNGQATPEQASAVNTALGQLNATDDAWCANPTGVPREQVANQLKETKTQLDAIFSTRGNDQPSSSAPRAARSL